MGVEIFSHTFNLPIEQPANPSSIKVSSCKWFISEEIKKVRKKNSISDYVIFSPICIPFSSENLSWLNLIFTPDSKVYLSLLYPGRESPMPINIVPRYSGILSCFFIGFDSLLFLRLAKALEILLLVFLGIITSSINPFSAATNGLANLSSYTFL